MYKLIGRCCNKYETQFKSQLFHLCYLIRLEHRRIQRRSSRSIHLGFSVICERSSADIRPTNRTNRIFDLEHKCSAPDILTWSHANCRRALTLDDCDRQMTPTTCFGCPTIRKFSIRRRPVQQSDENSANADKWVWPWSPAPTDVSLMHRRPQHTPYYQSALTQSNRRLGPTLCVFRPKTNQCCTDMVTGHDQWRPRSVPKIGRRKRTTEGERRAFLVVRLFFSFHGNRAHTHDARHTKILAAVFCCFPLLLLFSSFPIALCVIQFLSQISVCSWFFLTIIQRRRLRNVNAACPSSTFVTCSWKLSNWNGVRKPNEPKWNAITGGTDCWNNSDAYNSVPSPPRQTIKSILSVKSSRPSLQRKKNPCA